MFLVLYFKIVKDRNFVFLCMHLSIMKGVQFSFNCTAVLFLHGASFVLLTQGKVFAIQKYHSVFPVCFKTEWKYRAIAYIINSLSRHTHILYNLLFFPYMVIFFLYEFRRLAFFKNRICIIFFLIFVSKLIISASFSSTFKGYAKQKYLGNIW